MSTKPRPIKVTSKATKTISGKEKTIENAKTGKVTGVVAVMYRNGKPE
jgi:antitoxin component YwqK of YwqJK toxin-antitoxin module